MIGMTRRYLPVPPLVGPSICASCNLSKNSYIVMKLVTRVPRLKSNNEFVNRPLPGSQHDIKRKPINCHK